MSTVCKEQCSTCKCIIKETVLDNGTKPHDKGKEKDCTAMYKELGSCLNECLMEKSKERKHKSKH